MKTIIYGRDIKTANDKFKLIMNDYDLNDISTMIISEIRGSRATFVSGDVIESVVAFDGARGYKWNYAYIDSYIDDDALELIVFPNFVSRVVGDDLSLNRINIDDCFEMY